MANLIDALNDAAHQLAAFNREEAKSAIELIEGLLDLLYHLDYKALQVRNTSKRAIFRSGKLGSVQ
jgi:hypothetical protein